MTKNKDDEGAKDFEYQLSFQKRIFGLFYLIG